MESNHKIINKKIKTKKVQKKRKNISRIVVIGDVHGDWRATIRALKTANVIGVTDEKRDSGKLIWKGGSTIVVQMGDQVDRKNRTNTMDDEASEEKIIRLFDYLHRQAIRQGGGVYSILGNHELMNVEGDFSYASPEGINYFNNKYKGGRQLAFAPGGKFATYFANNRKAVLNIGGWIFSHAGITKKIADNYTIPQINKLVKRYLLGLEDPYENPDLNLILHSQEDSPFWTRIYGGNNVNANYFEYVLKKYNALGMIVGHTPQPFINSSFKKRLWRVDTGMSRAFGANNLSRVQVLEILYKENMVKKFNILSS